MTMKHVFTIFVFLFVLVWAAAPAGAQTQALNACVVLVLDDSGSMAENDPFFIRNLGAKLFISLLDDGDRVGLVRFATSAMRLTPELATVGAPVDKLALLNLLNDTPPDGYTDLLAGLREAASLLQDAGCDSSTIVLLSDGAPVLETGLPAGYTEELLALVRQLNVPIFAIALTAEGESGLLYQLASGTNPPGLVIPARSAGDLLDAYLDVMARLKDRTVAGSGFSASPGFVPLALDPALAPYISRATFIAAKPAAVSATLVGPGGARVAPDDPGLAFSATADPRFAVYTIDNPAPGDWGFTLEGSGQIQARVILRSRLRVIYEQPAAYHPLGQPMPLAASLIEEEADGSITTLIGQASFSIFIQRPDDSQDAIDMLYDDGSHGDEQAADGLFTNLYVKTSLAGEYQVTFTGYKGLIPASRTVRAMVVPFPQPVISSPSEPQFEFRGQSLSLAMGLEGGEPAVLDSGTFVAQVTAPDGQRLEVPLVESNGAWSAGFAPTQEGSHTIRFLAQDGTYKGVPYTLSAEAAVNIRLVPAIWVSSNWADLGMVEAAELDNGLPIRLDIVSSSPQPEILGVEVGGTPGLNITAVSPAEIAPGQSLLFVTLAGDMAPGIYRPVLLFSAREDVDLQGRELPIAIEVYQPLLSLPTEPLDEIQLRVDRQEKGREIDLPVASTSLKEEALTLVWVGPEGIEVETEMAMIPAGETFEAPLVIKSQGLAVGSYEGQIRLEGRTGLLVDPQSVATTLVVTPVPWCARLCLPVIGGTFLALVLGATGYKRLNKKPKPLGSLAPTRTPAGETLPAILPIRAGFGKSSVTIGSGRGADIRLVGGQVCAQHATIKAGRQMVAEKTGRPPKLVQVERLVSVVENQGDGLVKVNGVAVAKGHESAALRNGATIILGQYEFTYKA